MKNDLKLKSGLQYIKGVGERRAALFSRLGVNDVRSLIHFYPRTYEDWSTCFRVCEAPFDTPCAVRASICGEVTERITRSGRLYTALASDGQDELKLLFFNNKYAAQRLKYGVEYIFYGRVSGNFSQREMISPMFEEAQRSDAIRPIYHATAGLNSLAIAKVVRTALDAVSKTIVDPMPQEILDDNSLCCLNFALENIHFPADKKALDDARRRLIFDELFFLLLGLYRLKGQSRTDSDVRLCKEYIDDFFTKLPFTPTNAQIRCAREAARDMASGYAMRRLLQGDVGSGKTAVAAALMYALAKSGIQSALMAPTEILALQHYQTLCSLFQDADVKVASLTGSMTAKQKKEVYKKLRMGDIDVVTGTHALIQDTVEFDTLGLVVTDEQHRFGVAQRTALAKKGVNPHILVMSATPIPRTLSLVIFGDLDVSVLDEMPKGRQKIETYAVDTKKRERVYKYIEKHLDVGRQAYIVCPAVDESEIPLVSATEYYEKLKNERFTRYSVGLLHGKMPAAEKEDVMSRFSAGEIQLLVATTVIEVGIDVPNAVLMVVENAERFGLSQLHQLRGRVGRGKEKSSCILISDARNEDASQRLNVLCKTTDGFEIAEEDLKLRGAGDFFGKRQHGLPEMKIADLADSKAVSQASNAAKKLLLDDPGLLKPENRYINAAVERLFSSVSRDSG